MTDKKTTKKDLSMMTMFGGKIELEHEKVSKDRIINILLRKGLNQE